MHHDNKRKLTSTCRRKAMRAKLSFEGHMAAVEGMGRIVF
jgi:hypothetical protein